MPDAKTRDAARGTAHAKDPSSTSCGSVRLVSLGARIVLVTLFITGAEAAPAALTSLCALAVPCRGNDERERALYAEGAFESSGVTRRMMRGAVFELEDGVVGVVGVVAEASVGRRSWPVSVPKPKPKLVRCSERLE